MLLAWTCFHCASMWMNAHLDRDEAAVIFGTSTHIPAFVSYYSFVAFLLGIVLCVAVSWPLGVVGFCVAGLGWAYSSPTIRWKGHPIAGPLVNALGYGLLSPMAGWLIVDVPLTPRTLLTTLVVLLGIVGTYFCLQGYQAAEDRQRGYRTLVATHGPAFTLTVGRVCFALVIIFFGVLAVIGWYPRVIVCVAPAWLWFDRWIAQWGASTAPDRMFWPVGFVRRAAALGLLLFLCVFGAYVWDSFYGDAVAGLATRAGHPY